MAPQRDWCWQGIWLSMWGHPPYIMVNYLAPPLLCAQGSNVLSVHYCSITTARPWRMHRFEFILFSEHRSQVMISQAVVLAKRHNLSIRRFTLVSRTGWSWAWWRGRRSSSPRWTGRTWRGRRRWRRDRSSAWTESALPENSQNSIQNNIWRSSHSKTYLVYFCFSVKSGC